MKNKLIVVTALYLLNFHFTADAQPVVTTQAASGVTATNATLNGAVNPNGAVTTAYFQYGLTTNYGNIGTATVLPASNLTSNMPGFVVNSLQDTAGQIVMQTGLAGPTYWGGLATSADGLKMAAVRSAPGNIYLSTNAGATWTTSSAIVDYYVSIASSADGARLAAVTYSGSRIYISTNSGLIWTNTYTSSSGWNSIASSFDGLRLAAGGFDGIHTSTNGGVTWTLSTGGFWESIASSADGNRLAAVTYNGGIWTSTNGGLNWTQSSAPIAAWQCIASSADGTRLVAGTHNAGLYTSTNGGLTWQLTGLSFSTDWAAVASSADGTRFVAEAGFVYTSADSGATWTTFFPGVDPRNYGTVAISADATRLITADAYGWVYTSAGATSNLLPGTAYHYQLVGINVAGTTRGADMTFTTPSGAPTVTTLAASSVTGTNARLNGAVYTGGLSTTAYFQYGLTTNYGSFSATNTLASTNTARSVSNLLSSLAPLTTYHFRMVGSNSAGTSVGVDLTFSTGALLPTVTTLAASSITESNSILNGTVNPNSAATSAYFQYGVTTNYGSISATNSLAATNTTQSVSNLISSLSPGTTYHFRLAALSSAGTSLGSNLSFTTSTAVPSVTTLSAVGVTATNGTLRGTVNPNGPTTTAYFQYGLTTNYGSFSVTNNLTATNTTLSVSNLIGALAPGTTYHFRLAGINGVGTTLGTDLTFATSPLAPTVTTILASSVTATNASLNGSVNPGSGATTAYFQYGLTTNYGSFSVTNNLAATNTTLSVSNLIGDLAPGTTYHFRLVGINSTATTLGTDLTFTSSPLAPTVTTLASSSVTTTNATLNGSVNPGSGATTAYFQYGLTTNYGSFSATNSLAATNTTLSVSNSLASLSPSTTYHFRLVGLNSAATTVGNDLTLTTLGSPTVTTLAATAVGPTNATLNGTVSPNSAAATAYFQYGLTTNYGSFSATNSLAATNTTLSVSNLISGLTSGTTYYFRLVGINSLGTTLGSDLLFTTPGSPTVTTLAATAVGPTNATLNGTVNPNGAATTVYFQYGPTTNYGNLGTFTGLPATNVAQTVPGLVVNSVITGAAATNWTLASAPSAEWYSIASSSAGIWQVAVVSDGGIYTSTNIGVTWTQSSAPTANWRAVASSANGVRLAAVVAGGGIYTSTNRGVTWTQSGAPDAFWVSITSSSDGTRLAAGVSGGVIHTSTNGGVTWTPSSVPTALWSSIASSSDGMRLAAAANGGGNIYTSTDGGAIWTPSSAPSASWVALASSSDGTRLAAVVIGEYIYTSTNSGVTWTPTSAPSQLWRSIASSDDGRRLAAGINGGGIYSSTNGGVTWTPSDAPNAAWFAMACSGDGTRLTAGAAGGGRIYTSVGGAKSSLTPNTTYHYQLVGFNSQGTGLGDDLTFTTVGLPTVTTLAASSVTATNASLNGSVNPGNGTTTAYFQYGLTTNYGSFSVTNSLAATNTTISISNLISSLTPGTAYHFRLVALNSAGNRLGTNLTFTTSPLAPTVTTLTASSVTATNASLNGSINPGNGATTTYFQYGLTTNYGSFTATNSLVATNTTLAVSNLISGLTPGTTYHFRLVALNSAGTSLGGGLLFTTALFQPVPFSLNGSIQSSGGAFQLSFTNLSGLGFTVLGATNLGLPLSNWTVLGVPVEAPPGQYQFTDPQATNNAQRFYRVLSP